MKKIILTIMAVAVSFASCQDNKEQFPAEGGSSEVVFSSSISTRVSGTEWDADDQIGAFMFDCQSSEVVENSSNVLYAISNAANGTFASNSPLIYPAAVNVDFMAYYPYSENVSDGVISINTAEQSSAEKIKAQDFMVASAEDCYMGMKPSLSFTRKMSKIVISVDRKNTQPDAVLSDVSLGRIKTEGTLAITNDSSTIAAGSALSSISLFENENNKIEAIVLPQEGVSPTLSMYVDGKLFAVTFKGAFAENKQYNYDLAIGVDEVYISGGSITEWTEEDCGDIDSSIVTD